MSEPSRPELSEAAPHYHGYIEEAPTARLMEHLAEQVHEAETLLRPLSDEAAMFRYALGKWSIKEVLGHMSDTERIFAYRLLRIARGDTTPLPSFDENVYVAEAGSDRRPIGELLDEFLAVRTATVGLFRGVTDAAWLRQGTASGKTISARALAFIIDGHVAHHLRVLRERYGLKN